MLTPARRAAAARRKVGILGLTFKENVPDLRNSKIPDIVAELAPVRHRGDGPRSARRPRRRRTRSTRSSSRRSTSSTGLDALILAVAHNEYIAEHRRDLRARARRRRRDRRQERAAGRTQAAARDPALESVKPRRATTTSARSWSTRRGAGWSPASPASSARRCSSACSISARRVVGVDNFLTGHKRNLDDVLAINPDERLQFQLHRGRPPRSRRSRARRARTSTSCCTRPRSARCRARSRIRSRRTQHNVDAFLNVLRRGEGCRRRRAWSTRRARRSTAITRACRSSRIGSASRCRRTR